MYEDESASRLFSLNKKDPKKTSNGMKILIATGLFPPDIGGPAQYAKHIYDELQKQGHEVRVASFRHERNLPQGIRHFFYFARILSYVRKCDFIIAMDTFSVGFPAVLAAMIFGKKIAIRIGGDFLWESYIERTKKQITLKEFNSRIPRLTPKEKIIFYISRFIMQHASALVFNSEWQKEIFRQSYALNPHQIFVVENFYGIRTEGREPQKKIFLWAGRPLFLKNIDMLKRAFESAKKKRADISLELVTGMPFEALEEKIKDAYALILPSISDVNPNFIIDGVRAGKPFIMTRESGLSKRFCDIGVFVDPLNEKDIEEKILFLADEGHYEDYKNRIKQFSYIHSWEDVARDFLAVYPRI